MEHSWRPRPLQGNLCPTCSIPHFPFCPPPPHHHPIPFNQNPSFFPHTTPSSFQRPSFDPFLDHPGSNANLRRPFDDRFVDPRPWHRNPSLEFADGFAPRFDDHGATGFKRMRVDENLMDPPRISMDHERRLKLIRDHGGVSGVDVDHENGVYFRENSVFDRSFGGVDELRGGKNGMQLKPPSNYEMSDFRDPRFGSDFDREGSYFRSEPDFKTREHGSVFGQDSRSYRNEEIGQSQYGLANGHSRQRSDVATLYNEGGLRHQSNVSDSYSRIVDYPNDEVPSENYSSLSGKEPWYSPPTGWHELSGSSVRHHEKRSSFSTDNRDHNHHLAQPYAMNHDIHFHGQLDERSGNQGPVGYQNLPMATLPPRVVNVQPPLPASPPPPLPMDPPGHPLYEPRALPSPAMTSPSLFPIAVSSEATGPSLYAPIPQAHSLGRPYFHDKSHLHASTGFATEEFQNINRVYSAKYLGQDQPLPQRSSDKPKAVDASHIFKQPHRATRPDHIVIILRGLPGSGKSYLAKLLRDLEVENGGDAPRIHSMDDYFMTEVEKAEESDFSKSSSTVRGKKPIMKKVMEYCYEPEMEEAYRSSMLKAFKKTLDEGVFSLVIVDDRNLRVADFAQFWATAKRSGYEVYLVEAPYKDPVGCAARNVHGFTKDDIEKMAGQWEEAPSLYLKLDIKSLFQGDDLKESGIQEVDMDTEDGDSAGTLPGLEERNSEITVLPLRDHSPNGSSKDDKKWDVEGEHQREEVKELGRSKWSDDLDDGTAKRTEATKGNLNALSGLVKAYSKEGKSVHWGDQVGNTGFSIGAARKVNVSLVIGPGAGYNMKSNPLPEEQVSTRNNGESKGQNVFQERIRAERESFRVVFDKRRQRIRGLGLEEE